MSKRRGRNRYSNQRFKYRGTEYKSNFEVEVAKLLYRLRSQFKKKFKFDYEVEAFDYVLYRTYVPDFKIERDDGSVIFIEAKGVLDRETKAKMLAARDANPEATFVFLFQRNNPLRKGSSKRYGDWCEQHGFDWAVGEIPARWLFTNDSL